MQSYAYNHWYDTLEHKHCRGLTKVKVAHFHKLTEQNDFNAGSLLSKKCYLQIYYSGQKEVNS